MLLKLGFSTNNNSSSIVSYMIYYVHIQLLTNREGRKVRGVEVQISLYAGNHKVHIGDLNSNGVKLHFI